MIPPREKRHFQAHNHYMGCYYQHHHHHDLGCIAVQDCFFIASRAICECEPFFCSFVRLSSKYAGIHIRTTCEGKRSCRL